MTTTGAQPKKRVACDPMVGVVCREQEHSLIFKPQPRSFDKVRSHARIGVSQMSCDPFRLADALGDQSCRQRTNLTAVRFHEAHQRSHQALRIGDLAQDAQNTKGSFVVGGLLLKLLQKPNIKPWIGFKR